MKVGINNARFDWSDGLCGHRGRDNGETKNENEIWLRLVRQKAVPVYCCLGRVPCAAEDSFQSFFMAVLGTACPHIPHAKRYPAPSRNDNLVIEVASSTLYDRFVKADILQNFINEARGKPWLSRTADLSFKIWRQPDSYIGCLREDR